MFIRSSYIQEYQVNNLVQNIMNSKGQKVYTSMFNFSLYNDIFASPKYNKCHVVLKLVYVVFFSDASTIQSYTSKPQRRNSRTK